MNPQSGTKDYVFGIHSVEEALQSDSEIEKIFVVKGNQSDSLREIAQAARERNIPVSFVPTEKLNRITGKNHQGIIAYISAVQYKSLDNIIDQCYAEGKSPFILLLDQITDVRNFGAISRSAECAGVDAIVVTSRGSVLITADALKTSAGALSHIPVCRVRDLPTTVIFLKESGIQVVGASEKAATEIYDVEMAGPVALVMGSEESGMSSKTSEACSTLAKLPLFGKITSLNVSAAGTAMLYEIVRQRKIK